MALTQHSHPVTGENTDKAQQDTVQGQQGLQVQCHQPGHVLGQQAHLASRTHIDFNEEMVHLKL